ncbi:MAG TPA: homoserine kinase [Terriglobales bacterium]|nr:homoserine kinase [Terriglobales bacterium]
MPATRKESRAPGRTFSISLPATSANLGPAFDCAALAFGLFLKVEAQVASDCSVLARGRDADICGKVENHLILNTYREIFEAEGRPVVPLSMRLSNEIPIGKGCGSSAAARLAGIALAVHFGRLSWTDARIIAEASRREHHPDNAAACWKGGVAVAKMNEAAETLVVKILPKGKWPLLLAIPDKPLSTEEARRVLPLQYSRKDVVTNLQNSMLLLAGLVAGRSSIVAAALDDRIHQPYRAPLCPLLPTLQKLSGHPGVLGAVLSGAGPSVLIFGDPGISGARLKKLVAKHLRSQALEAELITTSICDRGASNTIVVKR